MTRITKFVFFCALTLVGNMSYLLGQAATASLSGDLLLWDVRDAEPALLARLAGCGGEPTSLSFSPLGVALAAACGGSPYLAPIPEWLEGEK